MRAMDMVDDGIDAGNGVGRCRDGVVGDGT